VCLATNLAKQSRTFNLRSPVPEFLNALVTGR